MVLGEIYSSTQTQQADSGSCKIYYTPQKRAGVGSRAQAQVGSPELEIGWLGECTDVEGERNKGLVYANMDRCTKEVSVPVESAFHK